MYWSMIDDSKLRGKPTTLNLGNSEKQEIKL